ncbi:M56 family metallopeptidase [Streptomyces sp. NPDC057889]|uniref:M56 family metallopeptidase n=1 Tax=unclassified Streptomyces TaxID=2593676 RepID=UPI003678328D
MTRPYSPRLSWGVWLHAGALILRLSGTAFFIFVAFSALQGGSLEGATAWRQLEVLTSLVAASAGWLVSHHLLYQWGRDTRQLHQRTQLAAVPTSPGLRSASTQVGLQPDQVVEVVDSSSSVFTYGTYRPRIVISRQLVEELTPEQLTAVLLHEESHLRRLDPLRRSLLAVASATFWYVPALRQWQSRQVMRQELIADRHALDTCGCRALAGALLAVSRDASGPVAAMGNSALLGARIAHLEGQTVSPPPLSRSIVVRSGVGVLCASLVAIGSILILGCP